MNYYNKTPSTRRTIGIAVVILLHALLVWALISGTALKVAKKVAKKVDVSVIEDAPPPPPPPPPKKIEEIVAKQSAPMPNAAPQVLRPETPPSTAPTNAITANATENPQNKGKSTTIDTAVKTPPAPPAPVGKTGSVNGNCTSMPRPTYPAVARDEEVFATVSFSITTGADGRVTGKNITVNGGGQYNGQFKSAVSAALSGYKCSPNSNLTGKFAFDPDE